MTHAATEWLLDELAPVVDAQPDAHDLLRIDRNNALLYDGSGTFDMNQAMSEKVENLRRGNYVGVRSVSRDGDPIGTEFDLDVDVVCSVRVEGMSHLERGHIDPTGQNAVSFAELYNAVRDRIWGLREWPDAGRSSAVNYTHLLVGNEANSSSEWADFYRYEFDVAFDGFEELP